MLVEGLKSKLITERDSILEVITGSLKRARLQNGDLLVVSSKVLALTQGRVRKINTQKDFDKLVAAESDKIIGKSQVTLTLKEGIFIPWAGIDRSNIKKGYAVLWPEKPFKAAEQICKALKKKYRLKNFGVIISDSHCVPLRRGVTGIAIGYAGFNGVNDLRGHKDLYGNKLKVTQQNMADMLATSANLVMGEAAEKTPFALIKKAPVKFSNKKTDPRESLIAPKICLFSPLYAKIKSNR